MPVKIHDMSNSELIVRGRQAKTMRTRQRHRDELIERHVRLAEAATRRLVRAGSPMYDEILSAAYVGLVSGTSAYLNANDIRSSYRRYVGEYCRKEAQAALCQEVSRGVLPVRVDGMSILGHWSVCTEEESTACNNVWGHEGSAFVHTLRVSPNGTNHKDSMMSILQDDLESLVEKPGEQYQMDRKKTIDLVESALEELEPRPKTEYREMIIEYLFLTGRFVRWDGTEASRAIASELRKIMKRLLYKRPDVLAAIQTLVEYERKEVF